MKNPKFIIALIVSVLVLILLFQNTQVVRVNIFFWTISMSQIILLPLMIILGFIAGYVTARLRGKARRERETGPQV